jgi:REP element-mobilizing transposase RayT
MGRRIRHEQPSAYYHVTSRGNNRALIQWGDVDCGMWERTLARVVRRYAWEVLSYCLLTNHYHLLIRVPEAGLSHGMCLLNGGYARQVNQRHGRRDHVFGRRFWSKHAEDEAYLRDAAHYIAWNPVRAGLARTPEDYRWSSHAALAGLAHAPSFLSVAALLGLFSPDPPTARIAYLRHVHDRRGP